MILFFDRQPYARFQRIAVRTVIRIVEDISVRITEESHPARHLGAVVHEILHGRPFIRQKSIRSDQPVVYVQQALKYPLPVRIDEVVTLEQRLLAKQVLRGVYRGIPYGDAVVRSRLRAERFFGRTGQCPARYGNITILPGVPVISVETVDRSEIVFCGHKFLLFGIGGIRYFLRIAPGVPYPGLTVLQEFLAGYAFNEHFQFGENGFQPHLLGSQQRELPCGHVELQHGSGYRKRINTRTVMLKLSFL